MWYPELDLFKKEDKVPTEEVVVLEKRIEAYKKAGLDTTKEEAYLAKVKGGSATTMANPTPTTVKKGTTTVTSTQSNKAQQKVLRFNVPKEDWDRAGSNFYAPIPEEQGTYKSFLVDMSKAIGKDGKEIEDQLTLIFETLDNVLTKQGRGAFFLSTKPTALWKVKNTLEALSIPVSIENGLEIDVNKVEFPVACLTTWANETYQGKTRFRIAEVSAPQNVEST